MKGLWSDHFPAAKNKKPPLETFSPCKTEGLWSQIFPADQKSEPPPPPPPPPRHERCLPCPTCNVAILRPSTSNSDLNPGRQFYTCPAKDHKFFKWADMVKPDELIDVPPDCVCTAGVCRARKMTMGPNKGRILFMCTVKKGEGSCGYKVWKDELERSANERACSFGSRMSNGGDTSHAYIDMVDESKQSDEVADNESPVSVLDNSRYLPCVRVTSAKMKQVQCDKPCESSREPSKRSRYGDLKARGSLVSSHSLKILLAMNSVPIEHTWVESAIRQNLINQLEGWWGRLVFHPMPCLMRHASKPFTIDVSLVLDYSAVQDRTHVSSRDSITIPRSLPGVGNYSETLLKPDHDAKIPAVKPFHVDLDVPSRSDPFHERKTDSAMSKSISKAFSQAADHLQNELLALLETMDVKEHEAMSRAAEAAFAALDRLLVDYQDFKNRIKGFIHCAISLAEIEQSMPETDSYQKIVDQCSSERMRLDEIISAHTKMKDTVMKRIEVVQEDIAATMERIFELEAELSCCEVEMRNIEHECEQTAEKKVVSEGNYVIACKKLEERQKLRKQKEADRNAAKVAFDRARALLRGTI